MSPAPRTHLVSVGTSSIGNCARAGGVAFGDVTDDALAAWLDRAEPIEGSAETNSLHRALGPGDRVVLFHSETESGTRAGRALERHLHNAHRVDLVRVDGLTLESQDTLREGLRAYVRLLVEWIEGERGGGREVVINATGGFKPQVSLATLVGAVYGVPVYYIFSEPGNRSLQANVWIAPLPVRWDPLFLATYRPALEWLGNGPRPLGEVSARVEGLGATRNGFDDMFWSFVERPGDGTAVLSPAGEMLVTAPDDRGGPASVAEALERAAEDHDVLEVWDTAGRAARASGFVRPGEILRALGAVAALAEAEFHGDGVRDWDGYFAERSIKHAQGESESTMNLHGNARRFTHGGQTHEVTRHLTLGKGDHTTCAQVYFDLDRERRVATVAYVGRHLPTATDDHNH